MHPLSVFPIGLIIVMAIDILYLSLNKQFYRRILDTTSEINKTFAVLAWITIVLAVQVMVLTRPGANRKQSALYGAFLGFFMYGLYNFTNASLYPSRFTPTIVIGDTLWGTMLTSILSVILCYLTHEVKIKG